jgi:hypothetical protein
MWLRRLPITLGAAVATMSVAGACGTAGGSKPKVDNELSLYRDNTYQFSLSYPADFVVREQPAEQLTGLEPRPLASFRILNTATDPADLEVRVFDADRTASLKGWLRSNGLLLGEPKPFQTAHVSGVEVCSSTMIAPGCSYFVLGNGWIYQLTSASVEGESIVRTFTL